MNFIFSHSCFSVFQAAKHRAEKQSNIASAKVSDQFLISSLGHSTNVMASKNQADCPVADY